MTTETVTPILLHELMFRAEALVSTCIAAFGVEGRRPAAPSVGIDTSEIADTVLVALETTEQAAKRIGKTDAIPGELSDAIDLMTVTWHALGAEKGQADFPESRRGLTTCPTQAVLRIALQKLEAAREAAEEVITADVKTRRATVKASAEEPVEVQA